MLTFAVLVPLVSHSIDNNMKKSWDGRKNVKKFSEMVGNRTFAHYAHNHNCWLLYFFSVECTRSNHDPSDAHCKLSNFQFVQRILFDQHFLRLVRIYLLLGQSIFTIHNNCQIEFTHENPKRPLRINHNKFDLFHRTNLIVRNWKKFDWFVQD